CVALSARCVTNSFGLFGFQLPYIDLYGFAMAVVLVAGLYLLLYRTRFGRSVRATMQDRTAALLIGVDVNRVAALTYGIGVAVTAAGGMIFGASGGGLNPKNGRHPLSRQLAHITPARARDLRRPVS